MIRLLGFAVLVWAAAACAVVAPGSDMSKLSYEKTGPETGLSGWHEIVITTRSASPWHDFFTQDAGWEQRSRSPIDPALHQLWDLPNTAAGTETVYANVGASSGFVRLVELEGVKQNVIRIDDRPWDSGGYFDFNVRVTGLSALREKMIVRGWHGDSEPIQYVFGPFEVIEWIARGPDGVRIAFIERLKPTLEGWPDLKVMSRTFNATQTVHDMDVAREFFQGVLGMKIYLEHIGASDTPGPNVLGLPFEAAATVNRVVYILHPDGVNEGSVELLAFEGATGRDLSARALPSNYGVSVLRYPVDDLDKTMTSIAARGGEFQSDVVELNLAPHGRVQIVAMKAPDGGRIEIYAPVN